jgi:hypothetical protein
VRADRFGRAAHGVVMVASQLLSPPTGTIISNRADFNRNDQAQHGMQITRFGAAPTGKQINHKAR